MKKIAIFSVPLLILTACSRQEISPVRIYEGQITIPTYQIGEPEKNPMFYLPANYQGAQLRIYPYPLLDKLTDNKIEKTYRGLFLENKYLQKHPFWLPVQNYSTKLQRKPTSLIRT